LRPEEHSFREDGKHRGDIRDCGSKKILDVDEANAEKPDSGKIALKAAQEQTMFTYIIPSRTPDNVNVFFGNGNGNGNGHFL
jgi:hypothetical protein